MAETGERTLTDPLTWFLVVLIHVATCPGKCPDIPAVTIQTPSKEVCKMIKDLNPDVPLECWGKPKESNP